MPETRKFNLPENLYNPDNQIRNVGFEIEYAGLLPDESALLIKDLVGGDIKKINNFSYSVDTEKYGEFRAELDADFLLKENYKKYLSDIGIDINKIAEHTSVDDFILDVASSVVPCEIITPPIPMTELVIANMLIDELRERKAKGTKESIFYAFRLHINIELASYEPDYILAIIRSFSVLYDWISSRSEVDFSRRLSLYIEPYPKKYLRLIMDPDYRPDQKRLISDYLKYVGSRNFALDLLPAFAMMNETFVMEMSKEPELIKPRPAFHYRLANSLVDRIGWCISDEWDYWLLIESLANDRRNLPVLTDMYARHIDPVIPDSASSWIKKVDEIVHP